MEKVTHRGSQVRLRRAADWQGGDLERWACWPWVMEVPAAQRDSVRRAKEAPTGPTAASAAGTDLRDPFRARLH